MTASSDNNIGLLFLVDGGDASGPQIGFAQFFPGQSPVVLPFPGIRFTAGLFLTMQGYLSNVPLPVFVQWATPCDCPAGIDHAG